MSLLRRLTFNLWYLSAPPWDTGISPPELLEYLQSHPPGRAIDLGCGTGTNVITLARAGWDALGVDFADIAIFQARRKARLARVKARFLARSVTHLRGIRGPFNFALDMGCLHAVADKPAYLAELKRLLAPRGHWLLYAFFKPDDEPEGPGLTSHDLDLIQKEMNLLHRQDGSDSRGRSSAWFLFERP
ncbi:MAG TPA: class I SAM-dependent methyltransferase [Anaerolineales bacterium]